MSHPPAFSLTPADLAIETGGGGFSVDELSALSRGAGRGWALDGLRISCELRGAELGGPLHVPCRKLIWGKGWGLP